MSVIWHQLPKILLNSSSDYSTFQMILIPWPQGYKTCNATSAFNIKKDNFIFLGIKHAAYFTSTKDIPPMKSHQQHVQFPKKMSHPLPSNNTRAARGVCLSGVRSGFSPPWAALMMQLTLKRHSALFNKPHNPLWAGEHWGGDKWWKSHSH